MAEAWADAGLPVVIVNPSTPVGERDIKPTPTGQMIVDFLNRRMPAYVDTGLNLVDVRDVAQGHLLAAEKGRIGERYILGNRNMTLKEILDDARRADGPARAARPAAALRSRSPPRPRRRGVARRDRPAAARLARERPHVARTGCSSTRARPCASSACRRRRSRSALARAVAWFRENGYVRAA